MSTELITIERQASRLSEQERAQLAMFLLETLEPTEEGDISEAWRLEAEARLAQVERGEVQLIPGEEVMARLRGRQA